MKTYRVEVESRRYTTIKNHYLRSTIIEEQPSMKLMRWGSKKSSYYKDFELQMPYTLYAFHGESQAESYVPFVKQMSIYFSPKPYAEARPEEIYTPPLGNIFGRGEVCFDYFDGLGSATMVDMMNTFWQKNFNRDVYTHTFALDLYSAMRKRAEIKSYNHVLKVYDYWQNNLNTPDKICNFLSEVPYMDIPKLRSPSSRIDSINNSRYFQSNNAQYFFDDEQFAYKYMSSNDHISMTMQVSLNDYQVFDVLKEEELSKEMDIF